MVQCKIKNKLSTQTSKLRIGMAAYFPEQKTLSNIHNQNQHCNDFQPIDVQKTDNHKPHNLTLAIMVHKPLKNLILNIKLKLSVTF